MNRSSWKRKKTRLLGLSIVLLFVLGCSLFAAPSTPDSGLFATLQASTPEGDLSPVASDATPTSPVFTGFTPIATPTGNPSNPGSAATSVLPPSSSDQPQGHIVFTCQVKTICP